MANREPKDATVLAARIAKAFPSLSAYSAATLAESLCSIERAQRRHAERCCSGEDGGYMRRVCDWIGDMSGKWHAVHDPEAEERAGERIRMRCGSWRARLRQLCSDGSVRPGDPVIELQHDPSGRVLLIQLPGEQEPASV